MLRPLKTINRVPKLKAVFDCVVISLKNVFNILIVYMLFQVSFRYPFKAQTMTSAKTLIFFSSSLLWLESNYSMESFSTVLILVNILLKSASKYFQPRKNLNSQKIISILLCHFRGHYFVYSVGSQNPPEVHQRSWERRPFHYDNVFMAMMTLFAVQTSEGWVA